MQELKMKIQLNICRCYYKLKRYESCIEEAKKILHYSKDNATCYLWMSLSYQNLSESTIPENSEEDRLSGAYEKLFRTYGALCVRFCEDDDVKIKHLQILSQNNILLENIKVFEAHTSDVLEQLVKKNIADHLRYDLVNYEYVILLRDGCYAITEGKG